MFISKKRFEAEIEKAKEEAVEKRDKERDLCDLWAKYYGLASDIEDLKEEIDKLKGAKETE